MSRRRTNGNGDIVALYRLAAIPEVPGGPEDGVARGRCHRHGVRGRDAVVIVTAEGPEVNLEVVVVENSTTLLALRRPLDCTPYILLCVQFGGVVFPVKMLFHVYC